jgi:serine/threonine protein phosphatase PrpC
VTRLVAGSATDIGLVRTKNQDHLLVAEPLFAVADGMGGHAAGEIASETALDALLGAIGAAPPEGGWTAGGIANAVRAAGEPSIPTTIAPEAEPG